jgi:hypothetical protein
MHLIAVRRDLTGYRHVHPELGADGTWRVPTPMGGPGAWRVIADFVPTGGDPVALGLDVTLPGRVDPRPLPAPAATATVDGYTVSLAGALVPGTDSRLSLEVTRAGAPVTDLEPHLGRYGHLVALRQGDLGYLHVHPQGAPGDGRTPAGPQVHFDVAVPSTGTYRLYLDFRHGGVVRTAEFTLPAGSPPGTPADPAAPDTPVDPPSGPAAPVSPADPGGPAAPTGDGHGGPGHRHDSEERP